MYWNDKRSSLRGTSTRKLYKFGDQINPVDISASRKKALMESDHIVSVNPVEKTEPKKTIKRGRPPKAAKPEEKPE